MEKPWMKNILQLQDIVQDKIPTHHSPEAQEHLQCLIECIQEMYSGNIRLREDLEKTAIKADALRYQQQENVKRDIKEKKQLLEQTAEQECNEVKKILQKHKEIVEEMKQTSETAVILEEENKQIEKEAAVARTKVEKMSFLTNSIMHNRHETVIHIKESRRDAYDAHDTAYGVVDAIKEIRIDAKTFCDFYEKEVTGVEKRAKVLNAKVCKEDKVMTVAKEESRKIERKLNISRRATKKNRTALTDHKDKLKVYHKNATRSTKTLEVKAEKRDKVRKQIAELEENLIHYKTVMKQKIKDKCEAIREIEDHTVDEVGAYEEIIKSKEDMAPILDGTMYVLKCKKCEVEEARERTLNVSLEVKGVTEYLVAKRTQRMNFKENLIINADQRETMENIYAMKFDQQYAKLRNETVMRMSVAKEVREMLENHEQFLADFEHFRRTCLDATEYNRNTFKNLQGSENDMITSLTQRRKKIAILNAELLAAKADLVEVKQRAQAKIHKMTESVENKQITISYLKGVLETHCENIFELKKVVEEEESRYKAAMTEYGKNYRLSKTMQKNIVTVKVNLQQNSYQIKEWIKLLQPARLDFLSQLMRHVIENWKSTRELYLSMWRYLILAEANREIITQNIQLLKALSSYRQECSAREKYINKNQSLLMESREMLRSMAAQGVEMTNSAVEGGSTDLEILQSDLKKGEIRNKDLALISSRLNFTISGINDAASDSHMIQPRADQPTKRHSWKELSEQQPLAIVLDKECMCTNRWFEPQDV